MRFASPLIIAVLTTSLLAACGRSADDLDEGGAAYPGVVAELDAEPEVTIDDEFGTDVRVFMHLEHFGGPDAETLEVVTATLRLDLEPYADIQLSIPADHPQFEGLADGETFDFALRGSIPDTHDDWGLCDDPQADGLRVTLDLVLRVTPGANDDEDEIVLETQAVSLACSHTG